MIGSHIMPTLRKKDYDSLVKLYEKNYTSCKKCNREWDLILIDNEPPYEVVNLS